MSIFLILLFLSASAVWAFFAKQAVPSEVTEVAHEYMDFVKKRAIEDAGFWDRKWKYKPICGQDSIVLGVPYEEYIVTSEKVCEFATTSDLMNNVSFYAFTYPVYDCSELMGAILVGDYKGEWRWLGRRYKDDGFVKRILELRGQFKAEDGYSVIYLRANKGFGTSVVILLNGQPYMIMPYSIWIRRELIGEDCHGKYPLLTAEEVLPVFVRYARKHKISVEKYIQSKKVE
jgi:hypothetical protein